jgi:hypothetical protein
VGDKRESEKEREGERKIVKVTKRGRRGER